MLAVFEKKEISNKPWYKKLLHKIVRPSPTGVLEMVETIPYIKISCEEDEKGFPWRRINEISLDCSGRILMPNNIFPPPNSEVVRFVPEEFPAKMLEKLAITVLRKAEMTPEKLSIALYGDFLFVQRALPLFIDFASDLRVISDDADKLADFIDGTTDLTGAVIMLTNDISCANVCNIVIAPNGIDHQYTGNEHSVLFAPKRSLCFSMQVMEADVKIPDWLMPAYRTFYDKMEFLSAFYEISKARRLEELEPVGGISRYGSISIDSIIRFFQTADKK